MAYKRIVFTKPNTAELLPYEPEPLMDDNILVRLAVSTISSGTERANLTGSKSYISIFISMYWFITHVI